MFLVSSCSCLCPIQWSQVLSREWRCSWSSADCDAPTTSEWSTILLHTKVRLILETWRYLESHCCYVLETEEFGYGSLVSGSEDVADCALHSAPHSNNCTYRVYSKCHNQVLWRWSKSPSKVKKNDLVIWLTEVGDRLLHSTLLS